MQQKLDCYMAKAQIEISLGVWRWYEHSNLPKYPYPFREWVQNEQMGTEPKIRLSLSIAQIWHQEYESQSRPEFATFPDRSPLQRV